MLVLYRLTSVAVVFVVGGVHALLLLTNVFPIALMIGSLLIVTILIARLLQWNFHSFEFWHLLSTPLLFLFSGYGLFFFLESFYTKGFLGLVLVILLALFTEHIFSYIHLPVIYQPFSIEHLGLLMNILTLFFLSVVGFGLRLFLQVPLWMLGVSFFILSLLIIYGTLWASKVEDDRARPYAFVGAVLMTELFIAIAFLPSGLYTSATFIAITSYLFLGLTRANAMHRLNRVLLRRYVLIFILLTTAIIGTSQWL
jgi:hypothetical protein